MKIKHLIIVGMILAILTIGVVSATDDVDKLAAGDGGAVLKEASDDVIESDGGDFLEEDSSDVIESDGGDVLEETSDDVIGADDDIRVNVRSNIKYGSDKDPVVIVVGNSNLTGELIVSAGENIIYNKNVVLERYLDSDLFIFNLPAADVPDLPLGSYVLNATFTPQGGNLSNGSASVTVNWDLSLYLLDFGEWHNVDDYLYIYCSADENRQIKVVVPKSLKSQVKYSFNGQNRTLDIKNGEGFITIPSTTLEIKDYNLAVQAGDKQKSVSVHVDSLINHMGMVSENQESYLDIILPKIYSGNASVYLYNSSTQETGALIGQGTIVNGHGSVLIQGLQKGEYYYLIKFEFSEYTLDNQTFILNVIENSPNITVSVTPNEIAVGSSITVSGAGPRGEANLYIDEVYIESIYGMESFSRPISNLDVGQHRIGVIYLSYEEGYQYSGVFNVTVKNKSQINANAITATYNVNKNLAISLKDANGKALSGAKVTVNLNGEKTYITDKKGQIKISTKGLAPKTYTVKIAFKGDADYYKSSKDVKVTVKKATPKLTAKNKKFKKSKKVKKYTVVLKSNVNKAMKKVKVTLKIKGKKAITVKTNSKGKATFKIKNLKKKGKFKAVITFKGNAYYDKVAKKVKITVK